MPITTDYNEFIIGCKKNKAIKYNIKSPDNPDPTSYHCWVANKDGDIKDYDFINYDFIKLGRGLNGDAVYTPFNMDKQKKIWADFKKRLETDQEYQIKKQYITSKKNEPLMGNCMFNVLRLYKQYKKDGYKIIIGSMGWKYNNYNNDVWYEYGNGE